MAEPSQPPTGTRPAPSLGGLLRYFLRLGALGFGGPIALAGAMHRDLVETKGWISEADYREGLTLAQLSPGPLAAQLAIYLGYVSGGVVGATLVGLIFILPSFLMVLGLAAPFFRRYGQQPDLKAIVQGVTAGATGAIAGSVVVLGRGAIRDFSTAALALATLLLVWKTRVPEPLLVVGAGLAGLLLFKG